MYIMYLWTRDDINISFGAAGLLDTRASRRQI